MLAVNRQTFISKISNFSRTFPRRVFSFRSGLLLESKKIKGETKINCHTKGKHFDSKISNISRYAIFSNFEYLCKHAQNRRCLAEEKRQKMKLKIRPITDIICVDIPAHAKPGTSIADI